ncbi:hypothetical protein, partial [Burkholderia cenocepacia]|uniref:hypothetical protein n=1 Tax=Burkholderia cenocepacia TaxID=95486 RepID=UPI00195523E5
RGGQTCCNPLSYKNQELSRDFRVFFATNLVTTSYNQYLISVPAVSSLKKYFSKLLTSRHYFKLNVLI